MSEIRSFRMAKSKSTPNKNEEWTKKSLELEIILPENVTEETFQESMVRTEQIIDDWLKVRETKQTPQVDLADIKMMFPEDLEQLLRFTPKKEYVHVKPVKFLGSDKFAKIAAIVKGMHGKYVSAGKESHFRIPYTKA